MGMRQRSLRHELVEACNAACAYVWGPMIDQSSPPLVTPTGWRDRHYRPLPSTARSMMTPDPAVASTSKPHSTPTTRSQKSESQDQRQWCPDHAMGESEEPVVDVVEGFAASGAGQLCDVVAVAAGYRYAKRGSAVVGDDRCFSPADTAINPTRTDF
jgi:hypothetical protein